MPRSQADTIGQAIESARSDSFFKSFVTARSEGLNGASAFLRSVPRADREVSA